MSLRHIHQDYTRLQRMKREQLLAKLGKLTVSNDIFVGLQLSLSLRSKKQAGLTSPYVLMPCSSDAG